MASTRSKAKPAVIAPPAPQAPVVMNITRDRLREPSTWAGVGTIIGTAAAAVATKDPSAIAATVASLLAIFLPERKAS